MQTLDRKDAYPDADGRRLLNKCHGRENVSAAERSIVRRCAVLTTELERLEVRCVVRKATTPLDNVSIPLLDRLSQSEPAHHSTICGSVNLILVVGIADQRWSSFHAS
jgi:hypothetical protein